MTHGCKHQVSCYCEWQVIGLGGYKHYKAMVFYRCFKKDWFVKHHNQMPKYCRANRHGKGCDAYEFGTHPLREEGTALSPLRYHKK